MPEELYETEKVYITYNPEVVTRDALILAISVEVSNLTGEAAQVLDEDGEPNTVVLRVPADILADLVELDGVIRGRSLGE